MPEPPQDPLSPARHRFKIRVPGTVSAPRRPHSRQESLSYVSLPCLLVFFALRDFVGYWPASLSLTSFYLWGVVLSFGLFAVLTHQLWRKSPLQTPGFSFLVDEFGIIWSDGRRDEVESWTTLAEIAQSATHFHFHRGKKAIWSVPKSAFKSASDTEIFWNFARHFWSQNQLKVPPIAEPK